VQNAITAKAPNATVLKNTVPKQWVDFDIYCQLLPNEDSNNPYYQSIPRTGAFEVSHKGVVRPFLLTIAHLLQIDVFSVAQLRVCLG